MSDGKIMEKLGACRALRAEGKPACRAREGKWGQCVHGSVGLRKNLFYFYGKQALIVV